MQVQANPVYQTSSRTARAITDRQTDRQIWIDEKISKYCLVAKNRPEKNSRNFDKRMALQQAHCHGWRQKKGETENSKSLMKRKGPWNLHSTWP